MKIQDFVKGRNVSYDTVRQYINRNPQLFDGHTGARRHIVLDDVAVGLLDAKYPLPKPVEIIEDAETRRQLIEAQQLIIRLQQQLVEAAPKIALAEQNQRFLDDMQLQNKELQEQLEATKQQLAEEQAKTWWDKLRGR